MNVPETSVVRMGPQGRIVVPADLRRELGLDEGSTMTATAQDGRLVLEPRSVVLERIRRRFSGVSSATHLSDDLLSDRRDEARREGDD
jgi:AbrB family looped-hinge helix DNA binding protein